MKRFAPWIAAAVVAATPICAASPASAADDCSVYEHSSAGITISDHDGANSTNGEIYLHVVSCSAHEATYRGGLKVDSTKGAVPGIFLRVSDSPNMWEFENATADVRPRTWLQPGQTEITTPSQTAREGQSVGVCVLTYDQPSPERGHCLVFRVD